MNCITTRLAAPCALAFLVAVSTAQADPTGTDYFVILDAQVVSPIDPGLIAFEGHTGSVVFDGLPDSVPNNLDPSIEFPGAGFVPGNELIVTESLSPNPDGSETVSIWIDAQSPGAPFPTPGAPLYNNTLAAFGLSVGAAGGLTWGQGPAVEVSDVIVEISFPETIVEVTPSFLGIGGEGTDEFPLEIFLELDPADFYSPSGAFDTGVKATDFHLTFTVRHIPEPSTIALIGIAGVAMLGVWRRRFA